MPTKSHTAKAKVKKPKSARSKSHTALKSPEPSELIPQDLQNFAESLGIDLSAQDTSSGLGTFLQSAQRSAQVHKARTLAGQRGKPSLLETMPADLYARMLLYVKLGAFDSVAAGSVGVSPTTFSTWMRRGHEDFAAQVSSPYSRLWLDVYHARCQARLMAEVQVKRENPLAWLQRGPGRTLPAVVQKESGEEAMAELPGWSGGNGNALSPSEETNGVNLTINTYGQAVAVQDANSEQPGIPAGARMAAALGVLQELGFISVTPKGQRALSKPDLTVAARPVPNQPVE